MLTHTPLLCPACSYDLDSLLPPRGSIRCPECGRRWFRAQVAALNAQKVYWGPTGWMLALCPVVALLVALATRLWPRIPPFSTAQAFIRAGVALFLWNWVALAIFFTLNSRKRLDDFSPLAGVFAGGIASVLLLFFGLVALLIMFG